MNKIFIGYRRDDGGHAWTVYHHLLLWFDEQDVFIDHESLDSGEIFKPALTKAIMDSDIFLAVIGQHWYSDQNRSRLRKDDDITRGEIRTAIELGKNILPVLLGGAQMPPQNELTSDISPICDRQAHPIPDSAHKAKLNQLVDKLRQTHGFTPRYRPPHGVTQAKHIGDHKLSVYFSDPVNALGRLQELLNDQGKASVIGQAILKGMGGVGKTQLALKYCETFGNQYVGVWWFRAETLMQLQQDYHYFCTVNEVAIVDGESPHYAVKRYLNRQPRWLLVFDNAEEEYGEKQEHLRPYLPAGDHHFIITTRSPELGDSAASITLDVWSEEQSLPFLQQRLTKASDDQLFMLCKTLGGLQLALEQACAYLKKTGSSVAAYCTTLENLERSKGILERQAAQENGYPYSVLATLSLSFDKLSDAAKELLRLCAWCAPEPIPDFLFRDHATSFVDTENIAVLTDGSDTKPSSLCLFEALQAAVVDDLIWGETVSELVGFALVQRLVDSCNIEEIETGLNTKSLLMHRLTQKVVIQRICSRPQDNETLAKLLNKAFPSEVRHPDSWPVAKVLAPHVIRLEEYYQADNSFPRPLSILISRLTHYLRVGPALYDQSLSIIKRAYEREKETLGLDHPDTLFNMEHLAMTLMCKGELLAAKELQECVLERSNESLGQDHRDILRSKINLALILYKIGDFKGAKELQEYVLVRFNKLLEPSDLDLLTTKNNLALTLCAIGDYQGAKDLQESVLKSFEESFGTGHPDFLTCMHNLALTICNMGDHEKARQLQEHVLERRNKVLGQHHPDSLTSMINLAFTLQKMECHQSAKDLQEDVLERCKVILGSDHPSTLTIMNNLALTIQSMGDPKCAKEFQEYVVERREKILGSNHPSTLVSKNNLALTLCDMGDYEGAKKLQEHVFERKKELLGSDHPGTLSSMSNLALILKKMGCYNDAIELQEYVMGRFLETHGPNHSDTLKSMNNLATTQFDMGNYKSAKELQEKTLGRCYEVLGHDHPFTLTAKSNLAFTAQALRVVGNNLNSKPFKKQISSRISTDITSPILNNTETKTGRNNPCPCKSGRKYKKCCGLK